MTLKIEMTGYEIRYKEKFTVNKDNVFLVKQWSFCPLEYRYYSYLVVIVSFFTFLNC